METTDQLQKILEWMKQISHSVNNLQHGQDRMTDQIQFLEKKLNNRIDALDERIDTLSDGVQALLKAMRGMRVEQFEDRTRFQKEIKKIRQEIRELMH